MDFRRGWGAFESAGTCDVDQGAMTAASSCESVTGEGDSPQTVRFRVAGLSRSAVEGHSGDEVTSETSRASALETTCGNGSNP